MLGVLFWCPNDENNKNGTQNRKRSDMILFLVGGLLAPHVGGLAPSSLDIQDTHRLQSNTKHRAVETDAALGNVRADRNGELEHAGDPCENAKILNGSHQENNQKEETRWHEVCEFLQLRTRACLDMEAEHDLPLFHA